MSNMNNICEFKLENRTKIVHMLISKDVPLSGSSYNIHQSLDNGQCKRLKFEQ